MASLLLTFPAAVEGKPVVTQRVSMEYSIGGEPTGPMHIGLFGLVVPKTAANFAGLCRGDKLRGGKPLQFKGSKMHRIIQGFMAQGGGVGDSYFGGLFPDESFRLPHNQAGRLSMANYGKNTNKAQFFITFRPQPHLNGKHVVFGQVESASLDILRKLEAVGTRQGKTTKTVFVTSCTVTDVAVES